MSTSYVNSQGTKFEVSNDAGTTFVEINGISSFSGLKGGSSTVIDTTTLQSSAKEKALGLKDEGQFSLSGQYYPSDAGQVILENARNDKSVVKIKITFDDKATSNGTGTIFTFDGLVSGVPVEGGVDAVLTMSTTIEVTGSIIYTPAT